MFLAFLGLGLVVFVNFAIIYHVISAVIDLYTDKGEDD